MRAADAPGLADALVEIAGALAPELGEGRSIVVWDLDRGAHRVLADSGAPDDLMRAAEARLAAGDNFFVVGSGPDARGSVQVCAVRDERAACGLFVDGTAQPHLDATIERLIGMAEQAMQKPVSSMSRTEKQEVVRFLDERGAFLIRRAVADVASRLGVTRFTIYNYLDREA